jgi:DNA-binding XRE family transcriptional regulator
MWRIEEHRRVDKQASSLPRDILKRYEKWKDIAMLSGPPGLRLIKGFRSFRLGISIPRHLPNRSQAAVISSDIDHCARLSEALMSQFRPAKKRVDVSVGESVRIIRELQGLSQTQLAQRTGIPQATLSAIENDRVRLGVERAKVLAKALKCHPAVLVFPGWDSQLESAA